MLCLVRDKHQLKNRWFQVGMFRHLPKGLSSVDEAGDCTTTASFCNRVAFPNPLAFLPLIRGGSKPTHSARHGFGFGDTELR